MEHEKELLIEQMKRQRFSPITGETAALYQKYNSIIDPHDPDEISQLLFYEGEYYFRIGNLNKAQQCLSRCISAPKNSSLRYLDALSHHLMGLLYMYLDQESVAYTNLMKSIRINRECKLSLELAVSYISLGRLYSGLGDHEKSIDYGKKALEELTHASDDTNYQKLLCLAFYGSFCFFSGNLKDAVLIQEQIAESASGNEPDFCTVAMLILQLQLAHYQNDHKAFDDAFRKFLAFASTSENFMELSKYYFDFFDFLSANGMQSESLQLLTSIQAYANKLPLVFLRYRILEMQLRYLRTYAKESEYLSVFQKLLDLRPQYEEELSSARSYSLEYVEQLHQSKYIYDQLEKKSKLDPMTGLLNKNTLQFLADESLSQSPADTGSALLLVDMDHFKQINDAFGHLTGDAILSDTAHIIRRFFAENTLCGRVGGDKFAIFVPDIEEPSSLILQAELLRQEIWNQTAERHMNVTTQASIGISFSSEVVSDYEALYRAADEALYQAKNEGRNKVIVA